MQEIRVLLLGTPKILVDGADKTPSRRKAVALLAYLMLRNKPENREHLATLLWPNTTSSQSLGSLRNALSALNKIGDIIRTEGQLVRISPEARIWVDAAEFLRIVSQLKDAGSSADSLTADQATFADQAVGLYRDDLLSGFALKDCPEFEDWLMSMSDGLQQDLGSLLRRLARYLEVSSPDRAGELYRRYLAMDEFSEETHRRLIRLYLNSGNSMAALRQYERCETQLRDELGVELDVETIALLDLINEMRSKGEGKTDEKERTKPGRAWQPGSRRRRIAFSAAGALFIIAVGIVLGFLIGTSTTGHFDIPAIVVLPFRHEIISEGNPAIAASMTDAIINELTITSGLRVKSWTTSEMYAKGGLGIQDIGQELKVAYAVEGLIVQDKTDLRIDARLVDAETDLQLWADSIPTTTNELIVAQTVLAQYITEEIYSLLRTEEVAYLLSADLFRNPQCETAFLLANYHGSIYLTKKDEGELYRIIKRAAGSDLYVCTGYMEQVDSFWGSAIFGLLPPPRAEELITLAVETLRKSEFEDQKLLLAEGMMELIYRGDQVMANQIFVKANRLSPSDDDVLRWLAISEAGEGRFAGALEYIDLAEIANPFHPNNGFYRAYLLYLMGQSDAAIETVTNMQLSRAEWLKQFLLGIAYLQKEWHQQAEKHLKQAVELYESPLAYAYLGYLYGQNGLEEEALRIVARIETLDHRLPSNAAPQGIISLGIGNTEPAQGLFEEARSVNDPLMLLLGYDPVFGDLIVKDKLIASNNGP